MTGYPSSPSVHRSWGFSLRTQLDNRGWERWATLGSGAAAVGIPTLAPGDSWPHPSMNWDAWLDAGEHAPSRCKKNGGCRCSVLHLMPVGSVIMVNNRGGEQSTCKWTDEISWKHEETSCIALRCPLIIRDRFLYLIAHQSTRLPNWLVCDTTSTLFFVMVSLPVAPFDCVQAQVLIASWFRGHLTRMGGFFM